MQYYTVLVFIFLAYFTLGSSFIHLRRPRGLRWGGKRVGGSRWGIHVNPWLIHVNVWQKSLQYCKVVSN